MTPFLGHTISTGCYFEVRHITDSEYVLNQTKSYAASENLFLRLKYLGNLKMYMLE